MTRVELAILLSICALLISLLLPAVEMARETSRNYQCKSNLRQIVTALNTYHDRNGVFPPAAIWGSEGLDLPTLNSHKDPTPVHVTRQNWLQLLLPDLDQASLAGRFDPSKPVCDAENLSARTTRVSSFTCPSDTCNRPDNAYEMPLPGGTHASFARGNYAMNGGSEWVQAGYATLSNPAPTTRRFKYSDSNREFQWWNNGIGGINVAFRETDLKNGKSTTVALEEVRAGVTSIDPRGVWGLGQISSSITWGHGMMGDAREPNSPEINADDILSGPEIARIIGREKLQLMGMPCCDHCNENAQATARSMHKNGVNLCFLDGAVRFTSNMVDHGLWHIMHSREVPSDAYESGRFETDLQGTPWSEAPPPPVTKSSNLNSAELPQELDNSIGMKFVLIPPGEFVMGLPNAENEPVLYPKNITPHTVSMPHSFYVSAHEVTQESFQRIMKYNPSWHSSSGGKTNISWGLTRPNTRLRV